MRSAVLAGFGVTFISRWAVEAELASGVLAEARIEGMNGTREIVLARGTARVPTRAAQEFAEFARERVAVLGRGLATGPA